MGDRVDRRAFLAGALRTGAAVTAAGAAGGLAGAVGAAGHAGPAGADEDHPDPSGGTPGAPAALTVNGLHDPVGVDPDALSFAWQVTDGRRGARQRRYELTVTGPQPSARRIWSSGPVESGRQAFVPYTGPALAADARYRWTVRTADGGGRWGPAAPPAAFTTGLRDGDWRAQWLRPGPPVPGLEAYTYLRTTRALPAGTIAFATAYVAAAHKYQLWLNGAELDTGPSFCFADEQYYQATDVTPAVRPGARNTFGVLHHWYGPGQGRPPSAPGLLAMVSVHYDDGRVITVGSDADWSSRVAEWLPAPQRNNDGGDFVEWIDARRAPPRWSEPGAADTGWSPAAVLGPVGTAPFTRLFAQRTRITEQQIGAVSVRTLPDGSVVADFGKVYAGRPVVRFRRGRGGRTVPMRVGYLLDPDGSVSSTHGTQGTDLSYSLVQRDGPQDFVPFTYLGFRYLQVDGPGEPLGHDQLMLLARHAALPDRPAASFSSSDPTLDAVWDLCAHSGRYTCQEQFVDTPTREKGQFVWDATNESQTVMAAFGEQNLTWQGIRDMVRSQDRYWQATGQVNEVYPNDDGPQDFPLFTALFPEWVWRYYLATGDDATVVGYLPSLRRLADYLTSTVASGTGLLSSLPPSTNGDSQYGYDYDTVADTTLNVLAVNAFSRIAQAAGLAGDAAVQADCTGRARSLAAAVNSRLVGPGGRYVDGLRADGGQSTVASQLANVAALAYGVVPDGRRAAVAAYVASLGIAVQPDHGMELLRALHAGGRDHDVVRVLTDGSVPGWAHILEVGGTFTWEAWTPSDLIGDSMSHGWGSSALAAIQEIVLGVTRAPPVAGGPPTRLELVPFAGGITGASGTVPTPAGDLSVSWRTGAGKGRQLTLDIPPNAEVACVLPGVAAAQVTESGTPVGRVAGLEVGPASPAGLALKVPAGTYRFSVTRS